MPNSNSLLCRFHVSKTFHDCLPKYTKDLTEQAKSEAKSLLIKMLYTDSEDQFQEAAQQQPQDLKTYMLKNQLPCKAFWEQHCTKKLLTWGNFTNNCLERHNRKLKTISDHHKSLPESISQFLKLHETEDIRFLQKFTDLQMKSRVVHVKSGPSSLVKKLETKA